MSKAKNSGFVQNISGAAKKKAMSGLDNANSAMNNFTNTNSTMKGLQNNISTISDKIKNVDGHLPGNINNKINTATNNVDYLTTKNRTLLNKAQQQGVVKNFFDSNVRNAQNEVMEAQKKLGNLTNQRNALRNTTLENLNIDLDKNLADMKQFKSSNSEYGNLKKNLTESQSAYDKAVRNTNRARKNLAIGTVGVGAGAYGINKAKQNSNNNKPLEYIY